MSKFTLDLSKAVQKANGRVGIVLRRTCMDLFSRIVMKTPVDTGRARANWTAGIGTIPTGTTEDVDKRGGDTVAKANEILKTAEPTGPVVYLANNLPYIGPLERGHSQKQAPAGMVRVSIIEIGGVVRDIVEEEKRR